MIALGSIITDLVARAPRLPHAGEVLIGDEFGIFQGGKGLNQAIAAQRLGADVTLIGRVGNDDFGNAFFPILEQEGIHSDFVTRDPRNGTGVSSLIIGEDSGQNVIIALPRANFAIPAADVEAAFSHVLGGRDALTGGVFLTQCETSAVSYTTGVRLARAAGMTTMLNAAPIPREPLTDELFALVDILIVNETEAAALTGMKVDALASSRHAAQWLLARGVKHALITLGGQGTLWLSHAQDSTADAELIPPFAVKQVDATAAGDAFCGALAASLADGMEMAQALRRASAAGAITVTRRGAFPALPTADEVAALLT